MYASPRTARILTFATVAAAGLLHFTCSKNEAPAKAAVPEDFARLVPADAAMFFYIPNIDNFQTNAKKLVGAFDRRKANEMDLAVEIAEDFGCAPELIQSTGPLAAGFSPAGGAGGEMSDVTIAEFNNVPELFKNQDKDKSKHTVSNGRFAAYSRTKELAAPGAAAAFHPLTQNLTSDRVPVGDFIFRADLKQIIASYGPLIDGFFNNITDNPAMAGPAAGMIGPMTAGVKSFTKELESVDVAGQMRGAMASIQFQVKAGSYTSTAATSAAKTDLLELMKYLPPSHAIRGAMTLNFQDIADWFQPMLEIGYSQFPEKLRKELIQYMKRAQEANRLLGDSLAVSMQFQKTGMDAVYIIPCDDADKFAIDYFKAINSSPEAALFYTSEKLADVQISGTTVRGMKYQIHMDKFIEMMKLSPEESASMKNAMQMNPMVDAMGKGMEVRIAGFKKYCMITIGGISVVEEILKNAQTGGTAPHPEISRLHKMTSGSRGYFFSIDFRGAMGGIFEMLKSSSPMFNDTLPPIPGGEPVMFTFGGYSKNNQWRGELSVDYAELGKLFQATTKR
ncbi:MAG: hypothetical protein ACKVS6_09205 [Planctomycetota bacterium]